MRMMDGCERCGRMCVSIISYSGSICSSHLARSSVIRMPHHAISLPFISHNIHTKPTHTHVVQMSRAICTHGKCILNARVRHYGLNILNRTQTANISWLRRPTIVKGHIFRFYVFSYFLTEPLIPQATERPHPQNVYHILGNEKTDSDSLL